MTIAKLRKYLKEKCQLENYNQLTIKYFVKNIRNTQVIGKVKRNSLSMNGLKSIMEIFPDISHGGI